MTPRLSGHISIFGLVLLCAFKSLLEIARQRSQEKFAILNLNSRSYVKILKNRTWAILVSGILKFKKGFTAYR